MARLSSVVWREGMHLAQHHFQTQSRYFEDSIHFALSNLFLAPHGLLGIAMDVDALRNELVSLVHARGIMPDGLAFQIPDGDPLPAPLAVRDRFSPTQDGHIVLLAIPEFREGQANCAPAAGTQTDDALRGDPRLATARTTAEEKLMADETSGRDEKKITLGRRNFSLLLDSDDAGGMVTLPIARVLRDGRGGFAYDPSYIPPVLQIGASDALLQLVRRVVEILEARSDSLSGSASAAPGGGTGANGGARHDVATFWLLHAIHSALAPLRHHLQVKQVRPEQSYAELARLGGALCTFALDSHPRSLPAYDHLKLAECFGALERHIRSHLEVVLPTRAIAIPLLQAEGWMHVGTVSDSRCFANATWILGVRSSLGGPELIQAVPRLVKMCFAAAFPKLVERAVAGLTLTYISAPPPAISPRSDTQYFSVAQAGPCWLKLRETGEVGIYAPDSLPDAQLDLLVLQES
jgi:type VI secretion system protein ImpJ